MENKLVCCVKWTIEKRRVIIPSIIILFLGGIFLFDFVLVSSTDGVSVSVSAWIDEMSHRYPILPFLFGVLCGHLFFGVKYKRKPIVIE